MKEESARAIIHAAENEAIGVEGDFRIRRDYSGRGMNGSTTWAVVARDMADFVGAVTSAAFELRPDKDSCDFVEDMRDLRFDNMGRGIVAY